MTLAEEQAAFDAALNDLLEEHRGEFVLFHEGAPVAFYPDYAAAFEAGLEQFGLDVEFLIGEVAPKSPQPASWAWEFGLVFGG